MIESVWGELLMMAGWFVAGWLIGDSHGYEKGREFGAWTQKEADEQR